MTEEKKEHKENHEKKEHEHKAQHHIEHHNKKSKFTIKKQDLWKYGVYALAALLVVSIIFNLMQYTSSSEGSSSTDLKEQNLKDAKEQDADSEKSEVKSDVTGEAELKFYVMSQCPYGTQVMDAIAPVLEKLGDAVDFEVNYISTDLGDGTFKSLHGEPETKGNIVQLCAAKYNSDKYMSMIVCQDKNAQAIPDNWEKCAEDNELDVENIKICYEGDEGIKLLSASAKKSQEAQASGSPTIYLNGAPYASGRSEADFLRALCANLEGHPECSNLPACASNADCQKTGKVGKCVNPGEEDAECEFSDPEPVTMVVLNDKRCGVDCDVTGVIASLKEIFQGLEVKEVDYNTEEGKELFESTEVGVLPVLLFDETVEQGEGYVQVERYLLEAGDYTSLRIGASFDPTKEICDNEKDDTGNKLIDCDDPDCEQALVCREEKEANLQVFIMSDCPYGRKAVEALKGVIDNFEDKIDYEIHYIANEAGDGFDSLHGQYEVDEDIIQLCTKEHSPDQWFDYVYCRSTKGVNGKDWKDCAEETEIDVDKVEACFDGDEGAELLREDIKIGNGLGIGSSPTWMTNNKYQFSGIDAETVKGGFCQYNGDIEGCENTLSSDTGDVPAGGSC